jgi:hypothetical protein
MNRRVFIGTVTGGLLAAPLAAGVDPRVARRQEKERQRVPRWLPSHRAPEGSRKRGKRIARPAVLDP